MFGIVLLRQSVDRFHLNLAGSLTTDFVVQCCDLAGISKSRFQITWSKKLQFVLYFCYSYRRFSGER